MTHVTHVSVQPRHHGAGGSQGPSWLIHCTMLLSTFMILVDTAWAGFQSSHSVSQNVHNYVSFSSNNTSERAFGNVPDSPERLMSSLLESPFYLQTLRSRSSTNSSSFPTFHYQCLAHSNSLSLTVSKNVQVRFVIVILGEIVPFHPS